MSNCSECGKSPVVAKGLCRKHYGRLYRTGSTEYSGRAMRPLEDRFWEKVDRRSDDECWEWRGAVTRHGYGTLGLGKAKDGKDMAHRVSYKLAHGDIPAGLYVLHACDNPSCVNPAHLRVGTAKENTHDAVSKKRLVNPPKLFGELNHKAKITAAYALEIRNNPHIKSKYFAEKFGLSVSTVSRIRCGQLWKSL